MQVSYEIDDIAMIGSTLLNRSQLWLKRGDISMAEALCRQAISKVEDLNNPMIRAEGFQTLGQIYNEKKEVIHARKLFCLAFRINRQCHNIIGLATSGYHYGKSLMEQNFPERAKRYLAVAKDIYEKVGDEDGIKNVDLLIND